MSPPCPHCQAPGRPLPAATIAAQHRGAPESTQGWHLCRDPDCPVIYYGPHAAAQAPDLRALPYGQNPSDDPLVCFCFAHRVSDLRGDLGEHGHSTIQAAIKSACRAGGDDCARKNPKGRCCLGDVAAVLRGAAPLGGPATESSCCGGSSPEPIVPPNTQPKNARATRWATLGAITAALLSSACCWLPLLLLATGASAAGLGAWFEAWRLPLLGLTALLLGAAFYFAYRPERACTDGSCATPNRTLRRFNRGLLWLSTALVLSFAAFPSYIGALLTSPSAPLTATHPITGMSCEGCTAHIREVLVALPSVTDAQADYPSKTVRIQWHQAPDLPTAQAAAAEIGYRLGPAQ